jgi:sulfur-carrier protein adenylyltransferase/sulfurtransferase
VKFWWLTDSARVGTEKAAVERLATDEGWFKLTRWRIDAFRLSADGVITAAGVEYPVRLIYPDQFPSVPAWVEPQDKEARWSGHQYGKGGTLCLELRPENWVPTASGADVLRSAFNLLRTENPLGDGAHERVPSAHNIGEVQSYDWGPTPVLIAGGCLDRLRASSSADVRAIRWSASDDVWPLMVFDGTDSAQPHHPPSFDLGTLRHELPVLVARAEAPTPTPPKRADLAEALGVALDPERHKDGIVLIAVGNDRITAFHSPDADSVFERQWVVLPEQRGARSGRQPAATAKRVAVVGLGSVGSKMAEMMLRSGIHKLLLVDGDVMLPVNLERHTLDWRDVGYRKVHAVKRRLLQIVPGASVDILAKNLNWQRSARHYASDIDQLASCDLIIDATGDVPTALLLGAIAADNEKPFVSAEVFEGGLGCVIARSIPGRDPTYTQGRSSYSEYCERQNVAPPRTGNRRYEALTTEGDPVVADDAAVSIAASHAARVALDILDGQVGPRDAPWLLMGFKAGWLFQTHGQTISLELARAAPPPAQEDPDARDFASSLLREAVGETKAPE